MKYLFFFFLLTAITFSGIAQKFTMLALDPLNSAFDEQNPLLSRDGKTLWFTIANHPQNMGGKKDLGDIWYATWQGRQWSSPVHGGSVINNRGYNAIAGLSDDGSWLLLFNHYDQHGDPAKTQGISLSRKTN